MIGLPSSRNKKDAPAGQDVDEETERSSASRQLRIVTSVVVPVVLVLAALLLLHHELRNYSVHDILRHVTAISPIRVVFAAAATLVAYLALAGYDWLGFQYIHHPLPLRKIVSAAFISYALSYNLGNTLITGGSVRYRLYSAWGLPASDVARVVFFCMLTFWIGLCTIAGAAFLREPQTIALAIHLPQAVIEPLGVALLALVGAYVFWTAVWRHPLRVRSWSFDVPPLWISLAQIAVTALDLVLAGTVLYILLPKDIGLSFMAFIGVYLIAICVGLVSQVPGGLGVFETVFLHLLPSSVSSTAVAGALVAYRGIYYLFPLILASVMLAVHEVQIRFKRVPAVQEAVAQWLWSMVPQVLAVVTFVSGTILLFSGATPAVTSRLHILARFLPLPVVEVSHLAGSVAGAGLIVLARGIQRRLDGAFWMTVVLLFTGIAASLLKGLDYEEATALSIVLLVVLPCRRHFYRRAALLDEPFSAGWLAVLGLTAGCSIWLGLFSFKHIEYDNDLWWHFALTANAPRFMRASVAVVCVLLLVGLRRLLRPASPTGTTPSPELIERVRPIINGSRDTHAYLALLRDKSLLMNEKENAFIMYAVRGRSWVAMNDPIGPPEEWPDLAWRFRELVDQHGGWTVFYQVKSEYLYVYLDLGLTAVKLGEEARVSLAGFSLDGSQRKGLRRSINRLEREGCSFALLDADETPASLDELQEISEAWLARKKTREKGFSLGFFRPDYVAQCPVGIVRRAGRTVAFANLWLGAEKEEVSIDLMRFRPDAPDGVMDFLFTQLILWSKGEGYRYFNLGMAPLSGLEQHPLAPLWHRVGAFVFRHGEHFYNFEGLRHYKQKFDPEWTPRYLAAPGGLALPRILVDLASLIAGGVRGILTK